MPERRLDLLTRQNAETCRNTQRHLHNRCLSWYASACVHVCTCVIVILVKCSSWPSCSRFRERSDSGAYKHAKGPCKKTRVYFKAPARGSNILGFSTGHSMYAAQNGATPTPSSRCALSTSIGWAQEQRLAHLPRTALVAGLLVAKLSVDRIKVEHDFRNHS